MSTIEYVDQVQKGLDRLPSMWEDKPYALGFMRANLEVLQEIEDILHQLNDERGLDTAVGKQLDVLGALLNTPRSGLLDSEYREVLKAKTALSNASGTSPDIKNSVRLLTGASVVHTIPHYPAATYVFANSLITYRQGLAIQDAAADGVKVRPIWYNGDDYFVPASRHLFGEFTLTDETGDPLLVEDGTGEYELTVEVDNTEGTLGGFTSLIPSAVGYQVVDGRGKFASVLPIDNESIATGYIIDHEGNYLVDDRNKFIAWRTDDPDGISPPVIPPEEDTAQDPTVFVYDSDKKGSGIVLSSSDKVATITTSSAGTAQAQGVINKLGKLYVEFELVEVDPNNFGVIPNTSVGVATEPLDEDWDGPFGTIDAISINYDGVRLHIGGSNYDTGDSIPTDGTVLMIAIDFPDQKIWVGRDGVWLLSGDPSSGTNAAAEVGGGTMLSLADGYFDGIDEWFVSSAGLGTPANGDSSVRILSTDNQNYTTPTGFNI